MIIIWSYGTYSFEMNYFGLGMVQNWNAASTAPPGGVVTTYRTLMGVGI